MIDGSRPCPGGSAARTCPSAPRNSRRSASSEGFITSSRSLRPQDCPFLSASRCRFREPVKTLASASITQRTVRLRAENAKDGEVVGGSERYSVKCPPRFRRGREMAITSFFGWDADQVRSGRSRVALAPRACETLPPCAEHILASWTGRPGYSRARLVFLDQLLPVRRWPNRSHVRATSSRVRENGNIRVRSERGVRWSRASIVEAEVVPLHRVEETPSRIGLREHEPQRRGSRALRRGRFFQVCGRTDVVPTPALGYAKVPRRFRLVQCGRRTQELPPRESWPRRRYRLELDDCWPTPPPNHPPPPPNTATPVRVLRIEVASVVNAGCGDGRELLVPLTFTTNVEGEFEERPFWPPPRGNWRTVDDAPRVRRAFAPWDAT